ncbi:unnamed protein product [Cladocopium goreaui]|uniref:Uncharacterized protein n=1 Tax=Cladocopium goreaui TaxID=2562237 RepID=A0A9P1FN86_9DINO|nr:unnamed protein product [Cladocopium goreaui]
MATASTSEVNAELLEKSDGVKVNPQESIVPRLPRRLKSLALLAVTLLVLGDGHFLVLAPRDRLRWTRGRALQRGMLQLAAPGPERSQALCVVNVAQIVGRLSNQGALINTVSTVCDYPALRRQRRGPVTEEEKQRCANFLMLTIINTDLIVGLVTGSLTACSQSLNVPANCATNIASMLGMIVLMAQAGVQIQLDCIDDRNITQKRDAAVAKAEEIKADVQRSVQKFLKDHGRDGLALLPANPAVPKNTVYSNGALCFGVITLVASFTMRLGVVLADAAFTCPYEQDTELGRRDCALDVLGVLGLVSVIIRFSGLASNACVAIVGDSNPTGQCVVATSSIPTAAFSLSAAAANVEAACKKAFETWDPNAWPFEKQVTFPLVDNGDVVLPVI